MAIKVSGPDVGETIGHHEVLDDQGDPISIQEIPGHNLVMVVFRGHW